MNGLNYFLYYVLKLIILFFTLLPAKFSLKLGEFLGSGAYLLLPSRRRITYQNLKRAFPDKDKRWPKKISRRVFKNFGRNLFEFLQYSSGRLSKKVDFEGPGKLSDGVIFLTGHLGNWEITGLSVTYKGYSLFPVYKKISTPAVDKLVNELRGSFGARPISYKGGTRKALKTIKKGGNIGVLIDQRISSGIPCTFFNRPVWVTHFNSLVVRSTGCEVIPIYSYHENEKIKVIADEPLEMLNTSDTVKSDLINTQKQISWIEKKVRENPEEWFWMHDFWKDSWPAIFLDRDGTINKDHGYVSKKEDLEFIPGVFEALRNFRKKGYILIVVTNQSGIARGYYSERDYKILNSYFLKKLEDEGITVDRVYYCPHHPDDNCSCRKPNPGMIKQATKNLNIQMEDSWVIGDKNSDVKLGKNVGIGTVKVGDKDEKSKEVKPDYRARDLTEASEFILKNGNV
ncbi:MAG: D-glycero-beta-D-manno-heptose 1,7-bisphosphate 7-phosphatase [Elusimicrobiota bacterium]